MYLCTMNNNKFNNLPNIVLLDCWLNDKEHNKAHLSVSIEQNDKNSIIYEITLDFNYMGISWESEFELELIKDIIRECRRYYFKYMRIPSVDELTRLIENHWYGSIE